MEKVSRETGQSEDLSLVVNNILEREKSLDSDDQKIGLLVISYYSSLGKDRLTDMLNHSSGVFLRAKRMVAELGIRENDDGYDEKLKAEKKKIIDSFDPENIVSFVKDVYQKQPIPEGEEIEHRTGILNYNINRDEKGKEEVEIHLHKKDSSGAVADGFQLQRSLALLCDELVRIKKIPGEIVARSWLMGVDSIRERSGLEKKKEVTFDSNVYYNPALWGQFLDGKGNLKEKEVRYLFENNEPRYEITEASLDIEDLFKRYGSQYLGKELVTVDDSKRLSEEKRLTELEDNIRDLLKKDKISEDSFSKALSMMDKHPAYKEFLKGPYGPRFLGILNESRLNNISFMNLINNHDNRPLSQEMEKEFVKLRDGYLAPLVEEKIITLGN